MLYNIYKLIIILILIGFQLSCEKEKSGPPNCFILQPKTNSKVVLGNSIKISVFASSATDNILQVVFSVDNIEEAEFQTAPYIFTWETEGYELGEHHIKAKATDFAGLSSESEINIEIIAYEIPLPIADSRDGNTYEVVEIGEQVWMVENLKYKIDYSLFVNNDNTNTEDYGYLYRTNLGVGENVCPEDYHIPSPDDWSQLFEFLGGESVAGGKLKEEGTERWKSPNLGATNLSGFTARPAGSFSWDLEPLAFGSSARFFTSSYGTYIFIDHDAEDVRTNIYHPSNEYYSIRCIRDY